MDQNKRTSKTKKTSSKNKTNSTFTVDTTKKAMNAKGVKNLHDNCKQVIMFHNILCKFWSNLKGVLPECKILIRAAIAVYKGMERNIYLAQVHDAMTPHIKRIAEFDEGIFSDDYHEGALNLLPEMDFKLILGELMNCDMDDEMRKKTIHSLFNHLQNIYIATEAAVAQVGAFDRSLAKQKEFLMSMLGNLNLDETLKERVAAMKASEEADESAGGGMMGMMGGLMGVGEMFSPEKLSELLGGDNFMIQLAREVASELDLGATDVSNPMGALMNLFADNGKKFQELIVTLGDKVQSKVQSGEIDVEKLMRDAELMKKKMAGVFGNIPGMSDLLNGDGIMKQFKEQFSKLSTKEQATYAHIPGILEKNIVDWTEADKAAFEIFMQQTGIKK